MLANKNRITVTIYCIKSYVNVLCLNTISYCTELTFSLYDFSLACLNCRRHCCCTLGPLLNKIGVTWTPALRYCNSQSDTSDGYWVTNREGSIYSVDKLDKRMTHILSEMEQEDTKFHRVTQNNTQVQTCQLFISAISHLIISHCSWLQVIETVENKTVDKDGREDYCTWHIVGTP